MDQNEKIKLLEAQIKNLEKIIELQDKLIAEQKNTSHIPGICVHDFGPGLSVYSPRYCRRCGQIEQAQWGWATNDVIITDGTAENTVTITNIGQD